MTHEPNVICAASPRRLAAVVFAGRVSIFPLKLTGFPLFKTQSESTARTGATREERVARGTSVGETRHRSDTEGQRA